MQRIARIAKLRLDAIEEYEKRHAAVWPEVKEAIVHSGIRNYSIHRQGEWLVSYFEIQDEVSLDDAAKVLEANPACRRWEHLMDGMRVTNWSVMKPVWHNEET